MSNAPGHFPMSVMFTAKDMKKSVSFYKDVLGFELEASWPDTGTPMWANLMLDGQSIMLGAAMPPDQIGANCGHLDEAAKKMMLRRAADFAEHKPGVGTMVYVMVKDVDAYHRQVGQKGLKASAPVTQFYGIRDFGVEDPDGYLLAFYTNVKMESCQSCGMPMKDAKPGVMFCQYCSNEKGALKSYEQVFEGTKRGYFMGMMKMSEADATKATKEHLAKMPAWKAHK